MAKLMTLKRRISSIKSTRQITKAMELVAASKLQRVQQRAAASRDYRELAYELLARLGASHEIAYQPLFAHRLIQTRLYVVMTSNTGLAGAFNANTLKALVMSAQADRAQHILSQVIMLGSKGAQLVRHLSDLQLVAYYPFFGDRPEQSDIQPLLTSVIELYGAAKVDEVRLVYAYSPSGLGQRVINQVLLPAQLPNASATLSPVLNFEPDADTVVQQVAKRLVEAQIWQAVLESQASEQLARMLAMKNATDNAGALVDDYTLEYQSERQAAITQEITEISAGVEAMRD